MKVLNPEYVVWKEGKFYVGQCFNVDISSFGETSEEAVNSLREAWELRLGVEPNARTKRVIAQAEKDYKAGKNISGPFTGAELDAYLRQLCD